VVDQAEIHRMAKSEDVEERKRAAEYLKNNFAMLENKEQAWDDLHRLTSDTDSEVRRGAADALGVRFRMYQIKTRRGTTCTGSRRTNTCMCKVRHLCPWCLLFTSSDEYKKQAWNDLHRLTQDKVREQATYALGACYSHIPEEYKKQAWDDLHRLTQDKIKSVQCCAASALGACYSHLPDEYRKQAWDDLHRLTQDKINPVRTDATDALGACYSHIPMNTENRRGTIFTGSRRTNTTMFEGGS